MGAYETLQEQLDSLARCEVRPFLLATDFQHDAGIAVHVVLLDPSDAVPNGYSTSPPLFTKRFSALNADEDVCAAADRMRTATMIAFAERFRMLLDDLDRGQCIAESSPPD